jgi:hypothetical protein
MASEHTADSRYVRFMDNGWLLGVGAAVGMLGCIICLVAPALGAPLAIIGMGLAGFQLGWDVRGEAEQSGSEGGQ